MSQANMPLKQAAFMETSRRDAWWLQPVIVFVALLAFVVYANVRLFEGGYYFSGASSSGSAANMRTNYLTPLYSPLIFEVADPKHHSTHGTNRHSWMEGRPGWLPGFVTPAMLILIVPAGFRLTCYYYRGAYYKAFWADPPACAVGEPRKGYLGENSLPLILQNVHRYFMYLAVAYLFVLGWDAIQGFRFWDAEAGRFKLGVGVGSLVLTLNVILLAGYTLGCHSLRHLVGGGLDEISKHPLRHKMYCGVSCLNTRHMQWAWVSLIWVSFTDVYVRQCASGAWTDLHFVLG